jgi:hypothetical protein
MAMHHHARFNAGAIWPLWIKVEIVCRHEIPSRAMSLKKRTETAHRHTLWRCGNRPICGVSSFMANLTFAQR